MYLSISANWYYLRWYPLGTPLDRQVAYSISRSWKPSTGQKSDQTRRLAPALPNHTINTRPSFCLNVNFVARSQELLYSWINRSLCPVARAINGYSTLAGRCSTWKATTLCRSPEVTPPPPSFKAGWMTIETKRAVIGDNFKAAFGEIVPIKSKKRWSNCIFLCWSRLGHCPGKIGDVCVKETNDSAPLICKWFQSLRFYSSHPMHQEEFRKRQWMGSLELLQVSKPRGIDYLLHGALETMQEKVSNINHFDIRSPNVLFLDT